MSAWMLWVLLGLAGAADKDAAPPCRVCLTSERAEMPEVVLSRLREAVRQETRCEVVDTPLDGVPHLSLRRDAPSRAHLELSHPDGRRLERDVPLDLDDDERVRALAIVAAHMLRNEAAELLASLTAREGASAVSVEADANSGTNAGADADADDDADTRTEADASMDANANGDAGPAPTTIMRLALGALFASVPAGGGLDATVVGGLEVSVTPIPWLAIGVRDLSGSGLIAPPQTWAAGGAPFVELAWRFDPTWSIHGQVCVDVRVIGGEDPVRAGVAPFVIAGGRVQILRELSIALQTALHVAASDAWATLLHGLPRAAILWSGGLSIALHL